MNNDQRTAHLIYGPIAAGKSTFARTLATEVNGVRFAIDEWMQVMFGADVPERMDMSWVMPRVARCQAQVWSVAQQILGTGTDVILELGLLRKTDRDSIKSKVEQAGHVVLFHFVDAPLPIRRQRVLCRNAEKGETYSFDVTPGMFGAMESCFEYPTDSELSDSHLVRAPQE
ncbi:ATP-binding protein [Pseudomonas lini]|uniref:AAA family ATPase n=1 Tax=Pseudomonas lini TaxID=163011 RepID=UPI0005791FF8|nr:AAA family ATPase [Pseudomonas lini]KNH44400.1 kinase [Pseudomonas lini]NSX07109.1 ATP-binding protein [Pseudomonas lini]